MFTSDPSMVILERISNDGCIMRRGAAGCQYSLTTLQQNCKSLLFHFFKLRWKSQHTENPSDCSFSTTDSSLDLHCGEEWKKGCSDQFGAFGCLDLD